MTLLFIGLQITFTSCSNNNEWELAWEENFDQDAIDYNIWSKVPRGTADWQNTQSYDDRCYDIKDGNLILKGIVNDNMEADTAKFLTGGLYTKGKKSFFGGRIEIRARLHGAKGAWPAFWMLPFDREKYKWPNGGEIDIMERLNYDSFAYQTVHSAYTYVLGIKEPNNYGTLEINPEDYNVYAVEINPESISFYINGKHNITYPKIETDEEGQFPFYIPMYLLIDMQLGGSWVGEVDPKDLPVQMEIDWVRYYTRK